MSKGLLSIPPEVTTVWADTGYGLVQDKGLVAKGEDLYHHDAMLNGRANQLSEMVPVDRIYSEFGRYIAAGATQYVLLNTSDIRPVSMTARVIMDTAWGGLPKGGGASETYAAWARAQFGAQAGDAIAKVWDGYFKAIPKLPSGDDYGDQIYHTEARQMLLTTMVTRPWYSIEGQSAKWNPVRTLGLNLDPNYGRDIDPDYADTTRAREVKVTATAAPRWDAVWTAAKAAEADVPVERRPFYEAYVLTRNRLQP